MYDPKNADERQRVEKVVHDMVDRALEMEGSCTVIICVFPTLGHARLTPLQGEHGVDLGKKSSLKKELGPDTIGAMRNIKKAFDPHWLLNPGKIFDPQD
jgi:D-lactate dehydrogenase (cytochrome)